MWDLIVSVPDHCLSFYFTFAEGQVKFSCNFIGHKTQRRSHRDEAAVSFPNSYQYLENDQDNVSCSIPINMIFTGV